MGRLLSLLLLLVSSGAWAQSLANYNAPNGSFVASAGTYTPLSGGTVPALSSGSLDDGLFNALPIGFTFFYNGTPYTTVSASTNGFVSFGATTSTSASNNLSGGTPRPIAAPLWDDLSLPSNSNFSYQTSGAAGSRVFTAEWKGANWYYNANPASQISFQLKLYEATGAVQFVYSPDDAVSPGASATASVGLTATATGSGNFLSLNNLGASPTLSSTSETNSIGTKPASGQTYTFTPPQVTPAAPGVSFTSVTASSFSLVITDNSTTETTFAVLRSTDNVNFTPVATIVSSGTTSPAGTGGTQTVAQTGLANGTTYYYRVYAATEGLAALTAGQQATLNGTFCGTGGVVTVGPGGNYPTLSGTGGALAALTAQGVCPGGVIIELLPGYTGSTETLPISYTFAASSASNPVTIRPAASATGASAIVLSLTNATALLDVNGGRNLVLDGRPGGVSGTSSSYLTLTNTSTAGAVLRFTSDAQNNVVQYCQLKSQNSGTSSGAVVFAATNTAAGGGNSNNTLRFNSIGSVSSTTGTTGFATNLIYAASGTNTANSGNVITGNNLLDYFNASNSSNGVLLASSNNTGWTITNNAFYQSGARTYSSGAVHYAINIGAATATGTGYTISGNFIGGGASTAASAAAPQPAAPAATYTMSGSTSRFYPMQLSFVSGGTNLVQGNTIRDISLTTTTSGTTPFFHAITLTAGNATIGGTSLAEGNSIGSGSANGSITVVSSSGQGITNGISSSSSGTVLIGYNTVAGITAGLATGNITQVINGIIATAGTLTIDNNTVGSITQANSLYVPNVTGTASVLVRGIVSTTTGSMSLNNNTVANLKSDNTGSTSAQVIGITATSGTAAVTLTGNTVRNLTNAAPNVSGGTSAALMGIYASNTSATATNVSTNTVFGLSGTAATGSGFNVLGIYYNGSATGTLALNRNFVHGLSLSTTTTTAASSIIGIQLAGGTTPLTNNMVRVGLDASGSSIGNGAVEITAIYKTTAAGVANNFYHNSLYVGGTANGGAATTAALRRTNTGTDVVRNNVLVNARSNGTATGTHAAVTLNATASTTFSNNVYYAPGTGGTVALVGGTPASSLSGDANSAVADPMFVNATAATPDLHIRTDVATPVESKGVALASVPDDFDGTPRNAGTPDVGADEGTFIGGDQVAPTISYTPLGNTTNTTTRTLSGVSIADDATGVGLATTAGSTRPRLYFRRLNLDGTAVDPGVINDNTSATAGWKYVEASGTNTASPFSFDIDYSLLAGGTGVVPGQRIQYFVVAQDAAGNVASNAGTLATSGPNKPGSVALTTNQLPSGPLNDYSISIVFGGTAYEVNASGTPSTPGNQTFTSLTGAGGLFAALNQGVLTASTTVTITSDLTEDGTIPLNQLTEQGAGGYALLLRGDGTRRTVSGPGFAQGLIRLNGADRVTIDGGAGQQLLFRNLNTTLSPTFTLLNDATGNTITRSIIEGGNTSATSATILFYNGTSTGNQNNVISGNDIRELTVAPNTVPNTAIRSVTDAGTATNQGNVVSGNDIHNFTGTGVALSATGNGDAWSIGGAAAAEGNRIYQDAARSTALTGISLASGNNHVVSNNKLYQTAGLNTSGFTGIYLSAGTGHTVSSNVIGGADATAGGSPLGVSGTTYGIRLAVGTTAPTSVQNNLIRNLANASTSSATYGLYASAGLLSIGTGSSTGSNTGNVIGDATPGLGISTKYDAYGIYLTSSTAGHAFTVSGNTVRNLQVLTGAGSLPFNYGLLAYSVDKSTVQNNTVRDLSIGSGVVNGRLYGIVVGQSGAHDVLGNTVTNLSSGTVPSSSNFTHTIGIISNSSGAVVVADNAVSNVALTSTTVVNSNSYFNLVAGVLMSASSGGGGKVLRNRVWNLSSQAPALATAPNLLDAVLGVGTADSYANLTAANNQIAPGSGSVAGVPVLGILNGGSGTGNAFYYNSVYLTGSGAVDSYAYRRTGSTASGALRNNIFYNERTGAGSHYAIGYQTAAGWPATTSNYNLLVTADNAKVGNTAGTARDFGTWKATSGGDASSTAYLPTAAEVGGSATGLFNAPATGDLTINAGFASTPSPIESGGTALAGTVDNDIQGDIRQGSPGYAGSGTKPDLGSDEYAGTVLPVMQYTGTVVTQNANPVFAGATTQQVLRVELTTTGSFNPLQLTQLTFTADGTTDLANISNARVYYTGTSSTFATTTAFGAATAPAFGAQGGFSFTGTQTLQTGTNYFFLVYDVTAGAATDNLVDATLTSLTIPAAPGSPFAIDPAVGAPAGARRILGPMNGSFTVGRTGGEAYATIKDALADLTARGLQTTGGVGVTFLLTNPAATTGAYDAASGEVFPLTIGTIAGADATRRVTIRPQTGVTASITGSNAKALILLDGADYVTLDGSNAPGGSSRDLSLTNTNTGTSSTVVYGQTGASTNSATNNVIQNLVVTGSGPTQTLMGIGFGSSTVSSTSLGTGNNGNQVLNNSISRVQYGIYSQGASASNRNTGTVISGNVLTTAAPGNVGRYGIYLGHESGAQVTLNAIGGLTSTSDVAAINLGAGTTQSTSAPSGNAVVDATVSRNTVSGVVSTGTASALGIVLGAATAGTTTISNNLVAGVVSSSSSSELTAGLYLGGGAGSTTNVYFNTVALSGSRDVGSTPPTGPSLALAVAGSNPVVVLRNNVLSNTQTTAGTGKTYALGLGYSAYTNLASSHNDLYTDGANALLASVGSGAFAGTSTTTLPALQTATGQEASSKNADPLFVGSTLVPNACALDNTGFVGTGISEDYAAAPRSSTPDLGAYEFGSTVSTDLRLQALTAPAAGSSCRTTTETVTVVVRNNGCDLTLSPANPLTLTVAVTGPAGPLPSLSLTVTSGTLLAGTAAAYTVSTAFDMTFGGSYTLVPSLSYAGDQTSSNDALAGVTIISTNPALTVSANATVCPGGSATLTASAPQYLNPNKVIFAETFEGATNAFTATSTGSQPLSGFSLVTAGYKLGGSGTPANGTAYNGPDGNAAGHYYVADSDKYGSSTGGVNSTITTLTSPSFSTLGFTGATLSFQHFYYYYSTDVTAQVEYSVNGGAWAVLADYEATGASVGSATTGATAALPLPAAALGQTDVRIRFSYETSYGFSWAIDNVSVAGPSLEDATFTWTPASGLSATTGSSVTATPSATTTYTVTANYAAINCASSKPVTVTVTDQTTWTGTQSTDWFDGRNWSACVPSNLTDALVPTVASGRYPAIGGGTAAVRSVRFSDNGQLTMTDGTLSVYQDWTRTGPGPSSALTGGTVAFVGAGAQQLTEAVGFANLTVAKTADTLHVAANPTVTGALTMSSGILKTYVLSTTHQVNLTGTLSETASSFVLGNVVTSAPLGTDGASSTFGGLGLTLTAHTTGGASLPGATTVTRMTGRPMYGMAGSTSIRRQFNIEPAVDTNLNVDMVFGYGDSAFELQGIGEGSLTLFSNAGVPGGWRQEGYTSRDAAANTVTLNGLNHLSLWTLGDAAVPLPVSLAAFTAQRQGTDAVLTWTTAQEKNNRGFEVQVSLDGHSFRPLGFVASETSTSTSARHYRFVDREAGKQGLRHYRLRQLDLDGTAALFGPRTVQFEQVIKLALAAWPNPLSGQELTLEVLSPAAGATELVLLDAVGRVVLRQTADLRAGAQRLSLHLSEQLPAGAYLLRLTSAGQTGTVRLVKQ
ncbi:hypothetical protein DLM85_19155 [Hymenobacter edaphi]|uniref:Sialidase N-terminal domain-containing protein n=2 Tax=Hymenobacter edaphi TaxID=2211146 RepID=A0A328BA79_9BACT|nr:hypothetical protein DLM85_19155 [Hymenobacter edaphi]